MLGHKVWQVLGTEFQVYGTMRRFDDHLRRTGIFDEQRIVTNVDAWCLDSVRRAITETRPEWVINCVGIIKQKQIVHDPKQAIYINALFPHLLAEICAEHGSRLIHISTDCVFSGRKGSYLETDPSDAEDQYGRTKFLGEVSSPGCLTIRTSIVGRDLFSDESLFDWFLSQAGKRVKGYARAIYTGLTTPALSREIGRVISRFPSLEGLHQVSSVPISKYDLLQMVNTAFHAGITIDRDEDFVLDRSLLSDHYWEMTNSQAPSWQQMVAELSQDPTDYNGFRRLLQ